MGMMASGIPAANKNRAAGQLAESGRGPKTCQLEGLRASLKHSFSKLSG